MNHKVQLLSLPLNDNIITGLSNLHTKHVTMSSSEPVGVKTNVLYLLNQECSFITGYSWCPCPLCFLSSWVHRRSEAFNSEAMQRIPPSIPHLPIVRVCLFRLLCSYLAKTEYEGICEDLVSRYLMYRIITVTGRQSSCLHWRVFWSIVVHQLITTIKMYLLKAL